jgi:LDH2 family malate/lactate/ureidoglycolate dehydrogenase
METVVEKIKASRLKVPGVEIRYPGERAQQEMAHRATAGIPLGAPTMAGLRKWAGELGVAPLAPLAA